MRIVYLSYERNVEIEQDHQIYYTDIKDIEKRGWETVTKEIIKLNPDIIIEREYDDDHALYMPLLHDVKEKIPSVTRAKWFINTPVAEGIHLLYASSIDIGFFATAPSRDKFKKFLGSNNAFWLPFSEDEGKNEGKLFLMLKMIKERRQK